MKKLLSLVLSALMLGSILPVSLPASADRVLSERYIFETENMAAEDIAYYDGATQDYFDYGNGVSGSYIRVENTAGVVGNYVELTLDIPVEGTYDLSYVYRIHPTSGTNQLYLNGQAVGEPRNFNDRTYGNENDMVTFLAENVTLREGENIFRLETTALSETGGDRITVDYILAASTERETIGYDKPVVFVSDMDYFDLRQHAEPDHIDMNFQSGGTLTFDLCTCKNQPILLDGVEYTKGFGLEPNDRTTAVLDIPIPDGAESFQTVVGINDHKKGSSYDQKNTVSLYIDGVLVYETEPLTFTHCETISLPIPYGAETLTIKEDCGGTSVNDHICFGDARFELGSANDTSLYDYEIQGGRTLEDGRDIYLLMPAGTDLTALEPAFRLADGASCDKASGQAVDFTEPVSYTVTAADGQTAVYTVTVYADGELTEDEAAAVSQAEAAIGAISTKVSMSDRQAVEDARAAFDALSGREKLAVSNYETLLAAEDAIETLLANPIRISCVGDSITWGGVAEKSYPVNLQEILGEDYWVYNGGVGGTTVSKNGNYPYWSTTSYQRSKEFNPDYVLIMLGTNDAQVANWDNCKDKIEGYFRELIAEYTALECDPTIVLASPAWYYLDPSSARYTAINVTISDMVERLAAEYGFTFVDISAVTENHPEWFQRDGIHPDDNGYRAIAEAFAEVFAGQSDAVLQTARLDGEVLADFSKTDSCQVPVDGPVDVEAVTFEASGRVEVSSRVQEAETILDITVTSPNGRYQNSYTLTLVDKNGQPDDTAQILEEAKAAAQGILGSFSATNATTAEDILAAVKVAVDNQAIDIAWAEPFRKEEAAGQAGSITGVIRLTYEGETAQIALSLVIPALEEVVKGDMNGDGNVDITDVMAACKVLARKTAGIPPTAEELARGDLDGLDGVTISDVMAICKILAREN